MRHGRVKDGSVTSFIPTLSKSLPGRARRKAFAVDSKGAIYGAEVGPKDLKKHVKK